MRLERTRVQQCQRGFRVRPAFAEPVIGLSVQVSTEMLRARRYVPGFRDQGSQSCLRFGYKVDISLHVFPLPSGLSFPAL